MRTIQWPAAKLAIQPVLTVRRADLGTPGAVLYAASYMRRRTGRPDAAPVLILDQGLSPAQASAAVCDALATLASKPALRLVADASDPKVHAVTGWMAARGPVVTQRAGTSIRPGVPSSKPVDLH